MNRRAKMKRRAAEDVKANYWPTVVVCMIPLVFSAASFAVDGWIWSVAVIAACYIIGTPLVIGVNRYLLANRKKKAEGSDVMVGFGFYANVVSVMFVVSLIEVLFGLLLVIPGILKAYQYRMVPYLLAEDPGKSLKECLKESTEMMTGEKYKAFVYDLSFIGWFALAVVTAGVAGIFWTGPYYMQSCAEFYVSLKERRHDLKEFNQMDEDAFYLD